MRLLLDACVLYPTILRGMLLGAAGQGAFTPLYSPRILAEWTHAAARRGAQAAADAQANAARLRAAHPEAEITPHPDAETTLSLPDPDDRHVLAAAIAGEAEAIVTLNVRDFPTRTLARHGLLLRTPDSLLTELHHDGNPIAALADTLFAQAHAAGAVTSRRAMLKRAYLPRLGKTLDAF